MGITDDDIIEAMTIYGGSFVQALAAAYRAADTTNRRTLYVGFADVFHEYRRLAELHAERAAQPGSCDSA